MRDRHNRWYSVAEVKTVLAGVATGKTNREIAAQLGRSYRSVKGFVGRNGMGRDMAPVCCPTCNRPMGRRG